MEIFDVMLEISSLAKTCLRFFFQEPLVKELKL